MESMVHMIPQKGKSRDTGQDGSNINRCSIVLLLMLNMYNYSTEIYSRLSNY